MSERNEHRETIERAKALSRINPDAASTQRALDAARGVIESAQLQHRRSRRRIWIMSSSIAAAVLILIGFVGSFLSNSASAADELKQVAEANQRYQGWVHLRGQEGAGETHFNTADGTWAEVERNDGKLFVRMYVPPRNEEIVYDGATNDLRIGQTWREFSKNWAKSIMEYPLTITDSLAMAKERGIPEPQIKKSTENGLDRFDITTRDDPKPSIVWVDPKTKLIQKMQSNIEGQTETMTCTYGDPIIHDAYDLGVPRSAKVIDTRPPANVEQLFTMLQKRCESAFGDTYVALIAETDANNEPEALTVIARDHDKLLNHRYLLSPEHGIWIGFHQPVPKGWPTPALVDVIEAMKHHPPVQGFVTDGHKGWTFIANDQTHGIESHSIGPDASIKIRFDVAGRIWPSQLRLGVFGAASKSEIISDKDHAGMIGLRVQQKIWTGQGSPDSQKENRSEEALYWLDPAHDDVPIESTQRNNRPGKDQLEFEWHIKYLDLKQLHSGEWYPARQHVEMTADMEGQKKPTNQTQDFVFQIFPGEHVDASLFTDPAKYPTTQR